MINVDYNMLKVDAMAGTYRLFGELHPTLEINLDNVELDMEEWERHYPKFVIPDYLKQIRHGMIKEVLSECESEFRFYKERYESIQSDDGYRINSVNFGAGRELAEEYCLCLFRADVYLMITAQIKSVHDSATSVAKLHSKQNIQPSNFEHYLTERGVDIMPVLEKKFTNAKPAMIAKLLFALRDLGCLNIDMPATGEQERLHFALTQSFGRIGERTSLNEALNRYNNPTDRQNDEIHVVKQFLKQLLGSE